MKGLRVALAALAAVVVAGCGGSPDSTQPQSDSLARYGDLPLTFVANRGQADARVGFAATGPGHGFYLGRGQVAMTLQRPAGDGVALALRFLGARDVAPAGAQRAAATFTYVEGSRQVAAPGFGEVVYRQLWPGIDMVLRGSGGQLKYEFHVHPGASAADIALAYRGAGGLRRDAGGGLAIDTPLGALHDAAPVAYQRLGGLRVPVRSAYRVSGGRYGFALGAYDRSRELVIDPALAYSTFLGGGGDDTPTGIAVDAAGDAYVTGYTQSPDFPTTLGAFSRRGSASNSLDAFVAKLNPSGTGLVYSTFVGGGNFDWGRAIAIDAAGNAYVAGQTQSTDFPTTRGALDRTFNVGSCPRCGIDQYDAFVLKLNAAGSGLSYSTFLGGTQMDDALGIALDAGGDAYVTGQTVSSDFPLTAGAFDTTRGGDYDAFVSKLNPAGSRLLYSTLLGGAGTELPAGVQVDAAGDAVVAGGTRSADFPGASGAASGLDAFVTKLNASGTAPLYSTVIGGAGNDSASDLALDAAGDAYVVGSTQSADFPATGGAGTGFALKLDPAGARDYATRLNGTLRAVAPAADGSAWLAGASDATGFVSDDAFNSVYAGGGSDAYVARLDPAGAALTFGSFLGGSSSEYGSDVALDGQGGVYMVGHTSSPDFATTPGALDRSWAGDPLVFWGDGFVAKVDTGAAAPPPPAATPTATPTPAPIGTPVPAGPLAAPTLLAPAADTQLRRGASVTFDWGDVDGAASYTIQVDDSDKFDSPLVAEATVAGSAFTTSSLPAKRLWWRVRADDGGAWSAVRRFEVK